MIYEIGPVSAATVLDHMALISEHSSEVSTNKERKLSPDRDKYLTLQRAGKLLVLGAWVGEELVGYSANIVDNHIHYDLVVAYNSALYVHPVYRATPMGLRLMAATREGCKAWGASVMLWHAKPDSQLNTLLQRKRLKVQDIVYQEEL